MKKIKRGTAFFLVFLLTISSMTLQAAPENANEQTEKQTEITEETVEEFEQNKLTDETKGQNEETIIDAYDIDKQTVQDQDTVMTDIDSAQENDIVDKEENVVEISDPVLEKNIRYQLGLADNENITREKMEKLTYLSIWGNLGQDKVENLKGLEYAINLETLDLYDNSISDLTPLSQLEKLSYVNLSYNMVEDITVLEQLPNLSYADLSNNPVEEYVFEKYAEPKDETLLFAEEGQFYLNAQDINDSSFFVGTSEKISFEIQDEEKEIAQIRDTNVLIMKQPGEITISVKLGDIEKKFAVTLVEPVGELDEEEKTDEFADVETGALGGALYEGSIWNIDGSTMSKVSEDKNITNYVSRKVYFFDKVDNETYEHAGIDADGILWYWGKSAIDSEYQAVEVESNVKALTNTGYLDQEGTYHFWSYSYAAEATAEPTEICTVPNVVEVTDTYLKQGDGSYIANCMPQLSRAILRTETPVIQIVGSTGVYALEENGNLWLSGLFHEWFLADTNVKEIGGGNSPVVLKKDGTVGGIGGDDTSIEADSLPGYDFLMKGDKLYSVNYIRDGIYLVDENVVDAAGRLYLKDNGEAWYSERRADNPKSYKVMSSVVSIASSTIYTTGTQKYQLVREDGSIWQMVVPDVPYKVFSKPWNYADEETGVSGSVDEIIDFPGNTKLVVEVVGSDTEEYKEQYAALQEKIKQQIGENIESNVFDIKLMTGEEKVDSNCIVTIRIPLPKNFGNNIKVVHQKEDGEIEILSHKIENGQVIFQTSNFSLFALVNIEDENVTPEDPSDPENPSTPEDPNGSQNPEGDNKEDITQQASGNKNDQLEVTAKVEQISGSKSKAAKTGDNSIVMIYMIAFAIGAVGFGIGLKKRKSK